MYIHLNDIIQIRNLYELYLYCIIHIFHDQLSVNDHYISLCSNILLMKFNLTSKKMVDSLYNYLSFSITNE
jgi:hypothetical protein